MPGDEQDNSIEASLARAFEATGISDDAEVAAPEAEAPEAPAEGGRERDEHGRFKAKEPAEEAADVPHPIQEPEAPAQPVEQPKPHPLADDAPARLDPAAKAAWANVPQEVRGSIHRTIRDLESGLQRYQEQTAPLKPWMERAQREGTTIQDALQHYVGMEDALRQNPLQGLDAICRNLGTDLRSVAAQVLGQPAPQRDETIEGLRAEIASLKQGFGTVQQTFEQQRQREVTSQIESFAAAHPRFDELSGEIAQMLATGYASSLEDAYAKAERLNPAPSPGPQTLTPAPAQTGTAHLSVKGAPSSGQSATTRSATTEEASRRALAAVGFNL